MPMIKAICISRSGKSWNPAGRDDAVKDKKQKFEQLSQPLLPFRKFLVRWAMHGGLAILFLALSLGLGMLGYHWIAELKWLDAFLNSSMILTGMGPVNIMPTAGAKVF